MDKPRAEPMLMASHVTISGMHSATHGNYLNLVLMEDNLEQNLCCGPQGHTFFKQKTHFKKFKTQGMKNV